VLEELPEKLRLMIELRKEMKRPEKRIGYMRIKKVIGELRGYESEDQDKDRKE
jgi:hypothetical protein